MITTEEETVFTFAELSEDAKEHARDWMRDCEMRDFDPCMEPYETAARIIGIEDIDIAYSGFYSQGDGASFKGTFSFVPGCCTAIRKEFGRDSELHRIADELSALNCRLRLAHGITLKGTITRNDARYCHDYTMQAEIHDENGDSPECLTVQDDDEFTDLMRRFARWIYKGLEEDYEYRLSDAAIDESIEANEYHFTEEGEIV